MQISILVSVLFIIFGIGCVFLAIKLRQRSFYLFFAALFLQIGLLLFLNSVHIIHIGFPRVWPLLSIFTGTALLPAAWHRFGVFKAKYAVLAAAFIALGVIMLIFAMRLTPFSLAQFVRDWWIVLVLLTGLIMILILLGSIFSEHSRNKKASVK